MRLKQIIGGERLVCEWIGTPFRTVECRKRVPIMQNGNSFLNLNPMKLVNLFVCRYNDRHGVAERNAKQELNREGAAATDLPRRRVFGGKRI